MVSQVEKKSQDCIGFTVTKQETQLPIVVPEKTEQGTQTEDIVKLVDDILEYTANVKLKIEPTDIKRETSEECDITYEYQADNIHSDDSDEVSLVELKKKKNQKSNSNGETQPKRAGRKKSKVAARETTPVDKYDKPSKNHNLDNCSTIEIKKNKLDKSGTKELVLDVKKLKKDPDDVEMFQCCICFNLFYLRNDILQHYR
jgi:D-alanyl-D-alanine carboxypeptidase